jgi:hypothetical protein
MECQHCDCGSHCSRGAKQQIRYDHHGVERSSGDMKKAKVPLFFLADNAFTLDFIWLFAGFDFEAIVKNARCVV